MNDILKVGTKYKLRSYINGPTRTIIASIVYEVIGITEYNSPEDSFRVESKYFNPFVDDWKITKNDSKWLQKLFEDGRLTIVGGTLKPTRYIIPHSCL